MDDIRATIHQHSGRFINQLRLTIRNQGLSFETEKTYVHWVLRFIRFHDLKHPNDLGAEEVEAFLGDLAENKRCAVATQRVALNALVFLFQRHLDKPLGDLNFSYARRRQRMPTPAAQSAMTR